MLHYIHVCRLWQIFFSSEGFTFAPSATSFKPDTITVLAAGGQINIFTKNKVAYGL